MQNLIDKYNLMPNPEGGYYAVFYESKQAVISPVVNKERKAITHIYFLLLKGQVSLFHKVAHDEIWNFYFTQTSADRICLGNVRRTVRDMITLTQSNIIETAICLFPIFFKTD